MTGGPGTTPQPSAVDIPPPPEAPPRPPRLSLLATLLPAVLGAGLAMLMGSWEFLAFTALTPATALMSSVGDRRHARSRTRSELARFRRDRARREALRSEALRLEGV